MRPPCKNAGDFALVAVNPIVLACCQAAGIFRELRVSVQVYKAQCALFAAGVSVCAMPCPTRPRRVLDVA